MYILCVCVYCEGACFSADKGPVCIFTFLPWLPHILRLPSCCCLPGFGCGLMKCSTAEQLTERVWTMIHVINILCRRRIEKKNIKLILIEWIPGNRSEEQDRFIAAHQFPLPGTDTKVYVRLVFLNNVVDTVNLPLRAGVQVCTYLFSPCWLGILGNAVFRKNCARDCWISNFVPFDTASALRGVMLWHTVSVFLRDRSVCRLSVVGRGLLWNWL